jgi:putative ABC transport system substrate-binding protein
MNKLVKKITAVAVTAVMVGGMLAGCSSSANSTDKDTSNDTKTYKVGVCQLVQHEALDAATQGFQDALNDKLGDRVEIDVQNAAGDPATCSTIVNGFVADQVDLIMANATDALQAAQQATTTIPIVATSITDFATALGITDWNGTTGMNVTGTSDLAPLDEQANMIKELCPDAKTVGILYSTAEANSVYQAKQVEKTLDDLGLSYKEYTVADTNDIASVTKTACDNSDVIYIPTDNTMASATGTIEPIVTSAKKVVIAGEEGICSGCGVATLSISYYSIGYKAGEMAADILENGTDPSTMEVEFASDLTKKYVADRATALGVTIPDDYTPIE